MSKTRPHTLTAGRSAPPFVSGNLLSFARTLGKIQILHIDLWYADGSTGEMNLTSSHVLFSEDLERQYICMKLYLRKSASDLGIIAYQGSMVHVKDGSLHVGATWDKVICANLEPLKPGEFH